MQPPRKATLQQVKRALPEKLPHGLRLQGLAARDSWLREFAKEKLYHSDRTDRALPITAPLHDIVGAANRMEAIRIAELEGAMSGPAPVVARAPRLPLSMLKRP